MQEKKKKHGGARDSAGRPPSGRVSYLTRLHPDSIAWIKRQSAKQKCDQCVVVEDAIDQKRGRKKR